MSDWPAEAIFVEDANALDWIGERLRTDRSVASMAPQGYGAYVRVFHPAYQLDETSGDWRTARWKEVAEWSSMDFNALSKFREIAEPVAFDTERCLYSEPYQGMLDDDICAALAGILGANTACQQRCFFALWEGYGGIRDNIPQVNSVSLQGRSYLLVEGPIDLACCLPETASYWWPADRVWVVVTGLDQDSTIIACNSATARALLADTRLEALEISPEATLILS